MPHLTSRESRGAATFELRAALELANHDPVEGLSALRSALNTYSEPQPWREIDSARKVLSM